MGYQSEGQLALALVLPLLVPILCALIYGTLMSRRALKVERVKMARLYNVTQGRRIR